jgi:hypothetical protein
MVPKGAMRQRWDAVLVPRLARQSDVYHLQKTGLYALPLELTAWQSLSLLPAGSRPTSCSAKTTCRCSLNIPKLIRQCFKG